MEEEKVLIDNFEMFFDIDKLMLYVIELVLKKGKGMYCNSYK